MWITMGKVRFPLLWAYICCRIGIHTLYIGIPIYGSYPRSVVDEGVFFVHRFHKFIPRPYISGYQKANPHIWGLAFLPVFELLPRYSEGYPHLSPFIHNFCLLIHSFVDNIADNCGKSRALAL